MLDWCRNGENLLSFGEFDKVSGHRHNWAEVNIRTWLPNSMTYTMRKGLVR